MDRNTKTYSRNFNTYKLSIKSYEKKVMSSLKDSGSKAFRRIIEEVSDSDDSIDELVQLPMEVCDKIIDSRPMPLSQRVIDTEQIDEITQEIIQDDTKDDDCISTSESSQEEVIQFLPEVECRALQSLEPFRMLNDTVIDRYMNHVLSNLSLTLKDKIHVFDNFFFSKVKSLPKSSDNEAQKLVERWDKHVKIFEKDYLVLPICDSAHWILLIICFAHKILPDNEDVIVIDSKTPKTLITPCLFIFDSLSYKYMTRFTDPIRSFLTARWQFERPLEEKRNFRDRVKFTEVNAKVPRQRNAVDCGVYVLDYFEKFFSNPLQSYYRIREGKDLSSEWLINGSTKRTVIKRAIVASLK